ncbi:hypothetical protein SLEP1_g49538 [Rubroshorea leprosula]|uniref:Translation initiation factor IF-3 n=2 Tax=Magnoliopsida TaxID=3398 RepID=A0AAV5LZE3_9ROSI|nr:hypothetical protein SLEP1_g49538 [Rubroshorea leprosula]
MAGITSTFPFNPLPLRITKAVSSLSSIESRFFGLHFRSPNSLSRSGSDSLKSLPSFTLRHLAISASYGGSGSQSVSEDDQTLDLSGIRSNSVRLIDEQQNMVGVVSKSEAIQMAEDAELDLVILSPDADPPVVRIMDYNKYRYEQQKKKKIQQKRTVLVILSPDADPPVVRIMDYNKYRYEQQKKKKIQQKRTNRMELKELKMGYNIDEHDYSVRLKAARKFLKDGDKVKVIVNLKGRENEFRNIAIELIRGFQNDVGELATEESKNFRDRNIFIVLVPNKAVLQKAQEPGKKKDQSTANEVSAGV